MLKLSNLGDNYAELPRPRRNPRSQVGMNQIRLPPVITNMVNREQGMHVEYRRLRAEYDAAFVRLKSEVANLTRLLEVSPAPVEEQQARERVEQALAFYRECRGRLAKLLARWQSRRPTIFAGQVENKQPVEELAYRLWEESGRPSGREMEHWLLAEEILRQRT